MNESELSDKIADTFREYAKDIQHMNQEELDLRERIDRAISERLN